MKLEPSNHRAIKENIERRIDIIIDADIHDTTFSGMEPPDDWKQYPEPALSESERSRIEKRLPSNRSNRGFLLYLENRARNDGAAISYKASEENLVMVKIEWPQS